ncbi:hypothetical protein [Streptomyces viridochromogenes]|uniref:hypothetical protein n=1 Tax=Streptomyces viridochromogenes TaxID=1938 RepID=UPI000AF21EEF|nr:hypothetical protein [Streptomyces viridochromogenes]
MERAVPPCVDLTAAVRGRPRSPRAAADVAVVRAERAVLHAAGDGLDLAVVLAHCRDRPADSKVPQNAAVVSGAPPRNAGGKLLENRIREEVRWGAPPR